jgi:hypothetical protein
VHVVSQRARVLRLRRTEQSTREYRGCCVAFLHSKRSRRPVPSAFRSSIARPNLKLTRDDKGVLVAEFHTNGGPFIMTAQSHTEFVDAFYRIAQDRANKIVILTGAGGEFITDVDWSSFGDVTDPGVWSQVHDEGVQVLET